MKTYIKAYDHSKKVWTVFSQDGDETRILKKSKSSKDINSYLSKKPKIKEELNRFTKKDYAFDGVVDEAKVQRRIEKEINKKTLDYDSFIEAEKLAKKYKYGKTELQEKRKKFIVPESETQEKHFKTKYFYTASSAGIFAIPKNQNDLLVSLVLKNKEYERFLFSFTDEDGNNVSMIIGKNDIDENPNVTKITLGGKMKNHFIDNDMPQGIGKGMIKIKGLI